MKPISESSFFHLVSHVFRHSWFGMPDVEIIALLEPLI